MTKTKSVLLLLFSFLFIHVAHSQTRFTVSGTVKDKKTGEVLIGARFTCWKFQNPQQTAIAMDSFPYLRLQVPII